MAEIERYDPVMGTRLYLCITKDGGREWVDRFYSTEMSDTEAERVAAEIGPHLINTGYLVEVLY
jgi:hypothetical protein